jgi:hypothetical protein
MIFAFTEEETFGVILPKISDLIRAELGNKVNIEYAALMKLVHSEPFEIVMSQIVESRLEPFRRALEEFSEKGERLAKALEKINIQLEARNEP